MKSPMITNANYLTPGEKENYSELQVLKSAAGWYVGTVYTDPGGWKEPGSRDSGYFSTEKEAEDELRLMTRLDVAGDMLRKTP